MAGILSKGISIGYCTGSSATTYTAIEGLQSIPDLGGDVDQVDVTCLADEAYKYINGIKNYGSLDFVFLYDNSETTSNFRVLKGLENTLTWFKVTFPDAVTEGSSGHGTEFVFQAYPHVKVAGAGVNAALTFTATMALQSDITVSNPA